MDDVELYRQQTLYQFLQALRKNEVTSPTLEITVNGIISTLEKKGFEDMDYGDFLKLERMFMDFPLSLDGHHMILAHQELERYIECLRYELEK